MATFNLFLEASQADSAITNSYRLFHPNGLTGQSLSLYGGNINHWGTINSTQLYITGGVGEESFINRLTGGIRVAGDCEFDKILNGVDIYGTSYIQTLTGGLNVTNGGFNVVGNSVNNGSFRNVGTVSVTGPTSITGATRIVGNTDIRGNFYQSGAFNVVSSSAEFRGNLDVTGSLDVFGPIRLSGNTTITATGGLTVSGPATVVGNSTLQGITNIVGELQLNGQPFYTQQLNQTTEVNYFLTGGECVTLLDSAGAILTTSNTGLVPRNQGPIITGTTRGNYAVDLQLSRDSITQVASGDYSALIGGRNNKVLGDHGVSVGGSGNTSAGEEAVVIGGYSNTAFGEFSAVVVGISNHASGQASAVVGGIGNKIHYQAYHSVALGGYENKISGSNNAILGGFRNSIGLANRATVIGGSYGTAYNNYERVLSSKQEEYARTAQVGEVVLSLHNGIYQLGSTESASYTNSGILIPANTMIAFKGVGGINSSAGGATFVELKGIATQTSFELERTYKFGTPSSNITGRITTGDGYFTPYYTFNLHEVNTALQGVGTLYLEMVYVPYSYTGPTTTLGPTTTTTPGPTTTPSPTTTTPGPTTTPSPTTTTVGP